ncbi:hypothetical protein [Nocardioides sp. LML1-1-1.1]|uniref:hypothetical protein n=1 Tax=Nocardioides sp. LML1-1-1.1 TaxID=3135248 RepID=UPI003441D9C7
MKKTTLGLASIALAATFSLTACGADEGKLAKEFCDLNKDLTAATKSGDADKVNKASKALTDWAEENKDVKGDEDKFTDAVKEECGDDVPNLP